MNTIVDWWLAVLHRLATPQDPCAELRRNLDARTLRDIGLDGGA